MYFNSAGGNFLKVHMQNHYEKVRCDLYIKDVTKRHIHSLMNINKSMKETRDTLKDIQASSGYYEEMQGIKTTSKPRTWKEQEGSSGRSQPYLGRSERQVTPKIQETKLKNLDDGGSKASNVEIGRSLKNYQEVQENMDYSSPGADSSNTGRKMNGVRSDIVPAGRLLRDEVLMLPDGRNVRSKERQEPNRQETDSAVNAKKSNVKEPQGEIQEKSNGGNFQNPDTRSTKLTGKSFLTSGTEESPESAKIGKSRTDTSRAGLKEYRSQSAPEKASRQARSESALKNSCRPRYSSAGDVKKVKIHASLSRTERKRILQELISSCTVPCDRSVLERERQRRLQDKIRTFFDLLFEKDDEDDNDDESDILEDN